MLNIPLPILLRRSKSGRLGDEWEAAYEPIIKDRLGVGLTRIRGRSAWCWVRLVIGDPAGWFRR